MTIQACSKSLLTLAHVLIVSALFLQLPAYAATSTPKQVPLKNTTAYITSTGYHGLSFGQKIDKKALSKAGLGYPTDANPYCYYVPVTKNVKRPSRSPVVLQIVDNRFGLVSVNDNSVALFSGNHIGDKVDKVLKLNHGLPTYEIDKYDNSGDHYHLIYTLPNKNQVKYSLSGGKHLHLATITPKQWNQKLINQLTGKVQNISIGIPAAIDLVEGCS